MVPLSLLDCQSTFHGAGSTQHQHPRMGACAMNAHFPHHRDNIACCFSSAGERFYFLPFKPAKEASCATETVRETIWSTETGREKKFGRCKRAVILIRHKPLGCYYTASPSSTSNASAYTRLASGTLCVLKEGAGSWFPLVLFQQTADMGCQGSRAGLRTHLREQWSFYF